LARRNQTAQDPHHEGKAHGERDDAPVDLHVDGDLNRQHRRDGAQDADQAVRQRHTNGAAGDGDQHRFRQQQADDAAS
jgi:hypothetical protein